jgi:serine protease Do
VISTDITSSQEGSGALINLDGKVIGLIMQSYNKQDQQNTVTAIGISEIKSLMEKLSNGVTPSYLGLEISTVTKEISTEYNLPEGVYIKNVQVDSPAMVAGLQIGDVIVKIGGTDVLTEEQYEEYIEETKTGQTIRVTVLRMGADGNYQEVVCEATLDVLQ